MTRLLRYTLLVLLARFADLSTVNVDAIARDFADQPGVAVS